ncbi:hypothetical protein HK405_009964 [Cladochytrium tenue]|nr:hypothetical protein HK405_009964 [Cladochytrium tenue]
MTGAEVLLHSHHKMSAVRFPRIELTVVANGSPFAERFAAEGFAVHHAPAPGRTVHCRPGSRRDLTLGLLEALREIAPNAVLHSLWPPASIAARMLGLPTACFLSVPMHPDVLAASGLLLDVPDALRLLTRLPARRAIACWLPRCAILGTPMFREHSPRRCAEAADWRGEPLGKVWHMLRTDFTIVNDLPDYAGLPLPAVTGPLFAPDAGPVPADIAAHLAAPGPKALAALAAAPARGWRSVVSVPRAVCTLDDTRAQLRATTPDSAPSHGGQGTMQTALAANTPIVGFGMQTEPLLTPSPLVCNMAPRILIFGTGSVGAVYTWALSNAVPASNITVICRSNYAAVAESGFTIHSTIWGNNLNVRPAVARSVPEAVAASAGEPFDYILVCAKAVPTTPSIAELIQPAVSGQTTVVLVQNGIAIEDEYAARFPENPLLSTVIYIPATQISPGVVEHKEFEHLHVGTYPAAAPPGAKAAARAFVDLLAAAGASATLHDDVQAERWSKLLLNASLNPICALSRCRDRQFIDSGAGALGLIRGVMMEVAALAQACGYASVNTELVEFQLARSTARAFPGVEPSMLADALAGKNLELESLVGNAVRIARQKNVPVPLMSTLYILATGLDKSFNVVAGA